MGHRQDLLEALARRDSRFESRSRRSRPGERSLVSSRASSGPSLDWRETSEGAGGGPRAGPKDGSGEGPLMG